MTLFVVGLIKYVGLTMQKAIGHRLKSTRITVIAVRVAPEMYLEQVKIYGYIGNQATVSLEGLNICWCTKIF